MALRPVSDLGLADATDVDSRSESAPVRPASRPRIREPAPRTRAPQGVRAARRKRGGLDKLQTEGGERTVVVKKSERPAVPLADEPTSFVQFMVAVELHERLAETSHALALDHRRLRHQKTILGALVWRYINPDQPQSLRELGLALDAFLSTNVSEAPAEVKVAAHLPFSLKYRLDGAALSLRRTRRDATAKTLLSALVWRFVDPVDLDPLILLLEPYYAATRPTPAPLPDAKPTAEAHELQ